MDDRLPDKIIVRMPNWVGDFVMAVAALKDLKAHFAAAHITLLIQGPLIDLLRGTSYYDEVISFPKQIREDKAQFKDLVEQIKQGHFDLGILFTHSFSSAYLFWKAKVKKRLGFSTQLRSFLLTHPVPLPFEAGREHLVITYKRLLQPLGIPLSKTLPELHISQSERQEVKQRFLGQPSGQLIGFNPTSAFGPAKNWPEERFRALVIKLLQKQRDATLVFFGDKMGAPLVDRIVKGLSSRVVNLSGCTTLRELVALIAQMDLFITNDSGPMHIAAALGVPLVALFGSTEPKATGPYGGGEVIYKSVACSPCFLKSCPLDFRCMRSIEVDEVLQAIESIVKRAPKFDI